MTLRALLFGCWASHEWIRERDSADRMILRCLNCHESHTPDLSKDPQQGPLHQPADVLGKPVYKVRRHLKPGNVRAFR